MYYIKPVLIAVSIVTLLIVLERISTTELRAVQNGESELWCHLHKGYQMIEPDNVKGLHSNGKWLFTNGSASACEVVKK